MTGPYIFTATGTKFFPFDPTPNTVDLLDIDYGLSHKARFSGQTREFYSVATHSVRVAEVVRVRGARPVVVLAALLHDAHEAYLADVPTPLKPFIRLEDGRTWADVERGIQRAIHAKVGIGVEEISAKEADLIKKADRILLQIEVDELFDGPTAKQFRKSLRNMPKVTEGDRRAAVEAFRFSTRLSMLMGELPGLGRKLGAGAGTVLHFDTEED
jgi:5'-deoxynucleotidase YfbR-like HD superfamily hydrolase